MHSVLIQISQMPQIFWDGMTTVIAAKNTQNAKVLRLP